MFVPRGLECTLKWYFEKFRHVEMKPTELAGMKTYTVGLFEAKEQHQQYSRNCKRAIQ